MPMANKFDATIQEAIDLFAAADYDRGVECLYDLASDWKTAGLDGQSFADLCKYIEDEAEQKSNDPLMREQIRAAMHRERGRQGRVILPASGIGGDHATH